MTQPTDVGEYRIEHDTMGEVRVPATALWQAQTQRAIENFPISGIPIDSELIAALGLIKAAAAETNAALGVSSQDTPTRSPRPRARSRPASTTPSFPSTCSRPGRAPRTNMNANEVIATPGQPASWASTVHPNDHVNASQSSNDVFPTAIHIAATEGVVTRPGARACATSPRRWRPRPPSWPTVVKAGRTHLMDATPVTLGQEFGGYAAQVRYGIERLDAALPRLAELPLGGTAVGTGINTPAGFAAAGDRDRCAESTGLPLTEARNHFEAQGARDGLVEASGAAAHHRGRASTRSPTTSAGWARARAPDWPRSTCPTCSPARSIMPGKVNPVVCRGDADGLRPGHRQRRRGRVRRARTGNFELNVMLPVMARNLLESIRLLASVSRLLADRCVAGIEANVERCRTLAESSPSIVTPLNRYIGYENAAAVAKQALKESKTIREVVIENGYIANGSLTEDQLDAALDVLAMTRRPV